MEHADVPFGYSISQKRSQTLFSRSASPGWYSSSTSHTRNHNSTVPSYFDFEQDHGPSQDPNPFWENEEPTVTPPPNNTEPSPPANDQYSTMSGLRRPWEVPGPAPRRFTGDGFDYRRPVRSASEQTMVPRDLDGQEGDVPIDLSRDEDVIDLTADDSGYGASQGNDAEGQEHNYRDGRSHQQGRDRNITAGPARLPRGMDIIIDLDNGEEEWRMATPPAPELGSPDLEFVSSRRIDPPRHDPPALFDPDEVQFLGAQPLSEEEVIRRRTRDMDRVLDLIGNMNGRFTHLRAQVDRYHAEVNRTAENLRRPPVPPPRAAPRGARGHIHVAFRAPMMDFDMVGFDMGLEQAVAPEPPAPTYNAPDKAPEGFTRDPQEQDVLICPNCEEELCLGDDEVKRQVWIVKGCGHVYCGECTTNRSIKKSSKGKEKSAKTRPFKECVVSDCARKVTSAKSMVQIFL